LEHDEERFLHSGDSYVAPGSARPGKVPVLANSKRHGGVDTEAMAEAAAEAAAAAAAAATNKHFKVGGPCWAYADAADVLLRMLHSVDCCQSGAGTALLLSAAALHAAMPPAPHS
jgi:hypothetical protein